jgi:hypothetical protein
MEGENIIPLAIFRLFTRQKAEICPVSRNNPSLFLKLEIPWKEM